jgi:hypothetical protein
MGTRGFWKFKHQDRQRCELALALALALRLRCAAPPPSFTYTILRTVYQLALLTGRCRNGNDLLQLCCPLGPCCTVPEPASHRLLETASTRSYTRLIYKKVHHPWPHITAPRTRTLTVHTHLRCPLPQARSEMKPEK